MCFVFQRGMLCERKHGHSEDAEADCDGNSTPIFQSVPTPVVQAQHKGLVHSSCDGLNIPRKSKKSKKNRNSNKSPSKSQPKKSHGSSKKNKKQKNKKARKTCFRFSLRLF